MSRDYPFLVAVLGDHNPPFQNRRRHIEAAAAHFLPPPIDPGRGVRAGLHIGLTIGAVF